MIGLAAVVADHGGALEYDLMTRTRYLASDIGGALPEGALLSFVRYLPPDSALKQEMDGDASWLTGQRNDMLLAAIHDQLAGLQFMLMRWHGVRAKKPKPIPRPGVSDGVQHVGKGEIPIADFDEWYYGGD